MAVVRIEVRYVRFARCKYFASRLFGEIHELETKLLGFRAIKTAIVGKKACGGLFAPAVLRVCGASALMVSAREISYCFMAIRMLSLWFVVIFLARNVFVAESLLKPRKKSKCVKKTKSTLKLHRKRI